MPAAKYLPPGGWRCLHGNTDLDMIPTDQTAERGLAMWSMMSTDGVNTPTNNKVM